MPSDDFLNFSAEQRVSGRSAASSPTPPDDLAARGLQPIEVPKYCDVVSTWPLEERFTDVLERTLPKLSGAIYNEFAAILQPATIGVIVAGLCVWVGSHAVFGAGLIVDCIAALFFCVGILATGAELTRAASEFIEFMRYAVYGQNRLAMERAAQHLANFVSMVGVGVLLALITRQARPVRRVPPNKLPQPKQLPPPTPRSPTTAPRPATGAANVARVASRLEANASLAGMVLSDARKIAEVARAQGKNHHGAIHKSCFHSLAGPRLSGETYGNQSQDQQGRICDCALER